MFHNKTLNNKINKIHERTLRIEYRDDTSSFTELFQKEYSDRALEQFTGSCYY